MSLFLIVSVPAWLILIISFYPKPSRGWRGVLLPFFGGLVAGILTISITLGLLTRNPFGVELSNLYPWAWYRGPGWMMTVIAAGLTLFYHFKPTAYSRIRELSCWIGGAVMVFTFWYALTPEPGFDVYRVFLSPFFWTGTAGAVIWLLDRGLRVDGWMTWMFYALAILMPSITTFIPVIYITAPYFIAWIIAILLSVSTIFLIFLDSRGRLS